MTAPQNSSNSKNIRTILVTDSGLGGLSVFNDVANRLATRSPWQRIKLVYVNAWPAPHRGYNHFETKARRVRVFDNALNAMAAFNPDEILIACNTLSVIYPHTPFCTASPIPVRGIVDHGVEMIHEKLAADPESRAVILGTPTTIAAKSHETALVRMGVAKDRIINIGCTNLAGWIEREPFSDTVGEMIRQFAGETAEALGGFTGNVHAALCCTHFGYRQSLFETAFAEFTRAAVTILNPNIRMAQYAVASGSSSQSPPDDLAMTIASKAEWADAQIGAYLELLPDIAATTRHALTHYTLDPKLFSVE